MKLKTIAFAIAAGGLAVGTAHAQSEPSVKLYGLIDTTIGTNDHASAANDRLTGFRTAWFSGDRWGLTGKEDLGSGLNVIFRLESEFTVADGAFDTPGVIFNRDSWVGFESKDLGKLTVGRQNALARDVSMIYGDPYNNPVVTTDEGGYSNNNNFKQLIFYAGSATGTRYDNGVVWKKVFDNGMFAGLGYQFGEVVGHPSYNTTETGALGYNAKDFHLSGFVNQANVNGFVHKSYSVGGNYQFPHVRVMAGYYHYTAEQAAALGERKDDAYTVSTKIEPGGATDFELGYQVMKANNAAQNGSGFTLNAYADASAATTAGTGKKGTLYGSVFHHLSKRTELYVAADVMKTDGGYLASQAHGADSQTELAVGMRLRF